ncbi:MAG: GHKL domain-containing protein [Turicibacter sp.]|nr:GHKL domain-containing protein [Turicibacter sp.]
MSYQIGILVLIVVTLSFSRYSRHTWKHSFFVLSNIITLVILSDYWGQFFAVIVTWLFSLDGANYFFSFSLISQIIISIVLFYVWRWLYRYTSAHDFLTHLDEDHSSILVYGLCTLVFFYYMISFLPPFLGIECFQVIFVQMIFVTFLTILSVALVLLFKSIVGKDHSLKMKHQQLKLVSEQLLKAQAGVAESATALSNAKYELEKLGLELRDKQQFADLLEQKVASLNGVYKKLSDFEHDQLNIMIALNGCIQSGDPEAIIEAFKSHAIFFQETIEFRLDSPDVSELIGSTMVAVRHLILTKSQIALNQSAKFTVETSQPIKKLGIDLGDFVRILGIWIDNALEELTHVEDKWVHVSFILDTDLDGFETLEVRVSNSCRKDLGFELTDLQKQGFSTKGEKRGSGLRIVEDIVLKNDHAYVSTSKSDAKFTQLLSIEMDKTDE